MFNPHPYDDPNAVNHLNVPSHMLDELVSGTENVALQLSSAVREARDKKSAAGGGEAVVVGVDGYMGADFGALTSALVKRLEQSGLKVVLVDIASAYKASEVLDAMFAENLPTNRAEDPVSLFGKLFHGRFADLWDAEGLANVQKRIGAAVQSADVVCVYGNGCAVSELRGLYDVLCWFDLTPKQAILRAKAGKVANIGDMTARPFKALMRRFYYVDFEVVGALRRELLTDAKSPLDYYICQDGAGELKLLSRDALRYIFASLVQQPFRCRPVYIEGVWGGSFIQKVRSLPEQMSKVAWVFDLIPLEVSIAVELQDGREFEFPYFTFVQHEGHALMGNDAVQRFGGYFPIRFNYDDTWHSSGNMSIQVHPDANYCRKNNGEHGSQDESYYVVATGHDAKTYLGFKSGVSKADFMKQARRSELEKTEIPYNDYIHSVPSSPGTQILLPGGIIHASGQNQVVLEIGSLTVGSYTYKLYDYLRRDLDGNPRPIHTFHGENVLKDKSAPEVETELVPQSRQIRGSENASEWLLGEHRDIYFSLRQLRLAIDAQIDDDTNGTFHVLCLVDGEKIIIESQSDPKRSYQASYLDMVVVPANVGKYRIRNLGNQHAIVHKTLLKG